MVLQHGTLDTSFGNGGTRLINFGNASSVAQAMTLQNDGKILIVGGRRTGLPQTRTSVDGAMILPAHGWLQAPPATAPHTASANDGGHGQIRDLITCPPSFLRYCRGYRISSSA